MARAGSSIFHENESERPDSLTPRSADVRSLAHLKMLHGVSSRLTRLLEIDEIGATVADELRQLIDYHNCRVFLRDGDDLRPVAFRGDLTQGSDSALDVLATKVGIGVTGHVAATGEAFLTGDAAHCEIGHHIEGTADIEESLLAVPLRYGADVVGVLVISKLGLDQFDADDQRLLEVLAGHASVAFVNARLYEAERREAKGAKALLELSRELSSGMQLDDVVDRIASGGARILGVERTSVWLPESEKAGSDIICRGAWSAPGVTGAARVGDRLPASVAATFARSPEPFVITLEEYESVVAEHFPGVLADAYALVPIGLDVGWGAITFALDGAESLDDRQLELLSAIAGQAKLALTNALNFETLERTFLSTVEALANALEAKDEYTSTHAQWIRDMSVMVAEELGLDAPTLKRVELGALFHDIGKIGIPSAILSKPGPLTDEEREIIETHPALGEQILAPIDQLEHVRPIVRACHERYDGKGYPDGLAGEEIPLEARIIFVCDAFHAMTTTRPYRDALPTEEAHRRLLKAAGSQFDPPSSTSACACFRPRSVRQPTRRRSRIERPSTSTWPRARITHEPAASSGSAVESSSSQRRPKRTGGSVKVSRSRQPLKSTRNESPTIGSPSRVSSMISAPFRNAPSADASPRSQSPCVIARPSGRNHHTSGAPESSCSSPVRKVGLRNTGC